jgi:UDP-GlcNAc:undecaprenyl-phosphate GlcNAc-1-phosphate transferase
VSSAILTFCVFLVAFALAVVLVPVAKAIGHRNGILDSPGPRKVHSDPTPRVGGIAVFTAFTLVVLAGYLGVPHVVQLELAREWLARPIVLLQEAYRVETKLLGLLLGGAITFVVGLLDDVLGSRFGPGWKLAGQTLAAIALVSSGIRTDFLVYEWLNVVFSVFWVVALTNAFNLLDNMDGLSAGVAFVASTVLLINACLLGELFIALLLVAFMGSLLGFLVYNWHPASIFLGDCGSLFIGFFLASLTLLQRYVSHASGTYFPILMPVLVLALPILDTLTVIVIRVREGRPIYVGDSRHLSHRLVSLGMKPPLAVATIYLLAFGLGLGATGLADADLVHATLILVQALAVVAVVLILLFYERRTEPRPGDP